MDMYLASPIIFFGGFFLLYTRWPVMRATGICMVFGALAIACTPRDIDNWYMALFLSVVGAAALVMFRPRWLRYSALRQVSLQFSLRQLLIAMVVLGGCLSFLIIVFRHRSEQADIARLVHPILTNHVSCVGIQHGDVVWLQANGLELTHEILIRSRKRFGDISRFSMTENAQQGLGGFGDADLKRIVDEHRRIRVLDLRRTEVNDRGLVHLPQLKELEWLWLDAHQCTESALSHLERLPKLCELTVANVGSTEGLTSLSDALPECQITAMAEPEPD